MRKDIKKFLFKDLKLFIYFIFYIFSLSSYGQYRRTFFVDENVDSMSLIKYLNKQKNIQKIKSINNFIPNDNNKEAAKASRIDKIRDDNLKLTGKDMTCAMWESGNPIEDHPDFYDNQSPNHTRIIRLGNTPNGNTAHGTAVAGTIASSGKGQERAKGMAPQSIIRSYNLNYEGGYTNNKYFNELKIEILSKTSILANNSWDFVTGYNEEGSTWGESSGANRYGLEEDYLFGFYSSFDSEMDKLLNQEEYYSIIFSSGNDRDDSGNIISPNGNIYPKDCLSGYDCLSGAHNSKNIIVVGAINQNKSFENISDIHLTNFSSVGPTDDGRIKPDIVAVGNKFTTTKNDKGYYIETVEGTSFSAPIVSGGSLLIQEHSKNELGNTLLGFTLKGLISNTAGELGDYIGPDYHYGWGLFDAKGAVDFISNINTSTFIAEDVLSNNETKTYYFAPKLDRITATLSWYDPEGTPVFDLSNEPTHQEAQKILLNNRTSMLINDLDLRLENGGSKYEPWKLDVSQPSNPPLRGDNSVDNIEEVYIDTDELQESIIKVTVSHKGTLKDILDEHFALLINGVQEINCNIYDGTSWSIKTPDGTDECLIFNGDYTISSDTTLTSPYIQIEKDMTLAVMNKSTLTINGSISNNGSLIIKPLATLRIQ